MSEFIRYALAVVIAGGVMVIGVMVMCWPFVVLAKLARASVVAMTPPPRSIKDELVAAQWEYDQKWGRNRK